MSQEKADSKTILEEIANKIGDNEYKNYKAGTAEFTEANVNIFQDRKQLVFAESCDAEEAKKIVEELKKKGMEEDKQYNKKDAPGVYVYKEPTTEENEEK